MGNCTCNPELPKGYHWPDGDPQHSQVCAAAARARSTSTGHLRVPKWVPAPKKKNQAK